MSISHPLPSVHFKYVALGPHYVALGPRVRPSGDIMFGPLAAYFPVHLWQGCDIVPIRQPWQLSIKVSFVYQIMWATLSQVIKSARVMKKAVAHLIPFMEEERLAAGGDGDDEVQWHSLNLTHTVLFFKIYAVEIGHQFWARGIIRIGQDYISSEYEQVPTSSFGEKSKKPLFYYKKCSWLCPQ